MSKMNHIRVPDKALAHYLTDVVDMIEPHWDGQDCINYLMAVVSDLERNDEFMDLYWNS